MLLFNTLTKTKEKFVPLNSTQATMYCCGPTVYNYAHIGNLRTYIFEDLLARTLRSEFKLKHVMNVTDVGHLTSDCDDGEDKMEVGAAREGKSAWDIAKFYENKFFEDFDSLNCVRPSVIARASEHIEDMLNLVKTLEAKGFTYKTEDGIYFDSSKFPNYGALAGQSHIKGIKAGARVSFNESKRNNTDFALWKFSPKDKKRQMQWPSPWGSGFPGWHIECSAMAMKYLGQTIDIHCGGVDHIAIHHTNEIAQSEAATGKRYVNNWVHGEFLVMSAGKMSKSDGSFITLDVLKQKGYRPMDYRYLCLGAHYRTQLEFSRESLEFAKTTLKGLKERVKNIKAHSSPASGEFKSLESARQNFLNAMHDDLNAPKALSVLWEYIKSSATAGEKLEFVKYADNFLGLDLLKEEETKPLPQEAVDLIERRKAARAAKDFKTSDELRDELAKMGVEIKDLSYGMEWRWK